jgi:MFS family permease
MRALLADRRIRTFFLANAVSTLGDYALWLALGVWVKLLTGSTGLAGVTFLMLILGSLLGPVTGILVDRVKRRPLLLVTYLATAALLMCLLLVHGRGQVWIVFAVTFLYGVSSTITAGAQQALMQKIVPAEHFADANGIEQTATQGMRLITPLVGVGLLAWLGGHAVAVMDAATFVIGALLLLSVRIDEERPQRAERVAGETSTGAHWLADVSTGLGYVLHNAVLRQITIAMAAAMFFGGFFETLGLQIVTVGLHHAASWVGVVVTVQGIGGLAGGVTAGTVARKIGDGMLTAAALGVFTAFCLMVAAPNEAVVLAGAVLSGFALPWCIVGSMTVAQKHTPNPMMGRVMGALNLAMEGPQSLGIASGAALVDIVFYRDLCYIAAAGVAIAAVYLATRKEQRQRIAGAAEGSAPLDAEPDGAHNSVQAVQP